METKTAICKYCGTRFQVRHVYFPLSRNKNEYCSQTCANRANAKSGTANPMSRPRVTVSCASCGKPFEVRPSDVTKNEKRNSQFCCSKECRIALTRTLTGDKRYNHKGDPKEMACEICGAKRLVRYSMQNRFRACSKRCASELARRTWPRISSIEQMMSEAFATAGMMVMAQHPIDFYTVDFALPDAKIAIECDGDYWHGTDRQQAKDRQKDSYLKRNGWRIVRLWEHEIRESATACVARVREALQSR